MDFSLICQTPSSRGCLTAIRSCWSGRGKRARPCNACRPAGVAGIDNGCRNVCREIIMDSLTHIVLGAAIGELVAGRKLGKKALVVGAVANSLPDLDFLGGLWLDTSRNVCFHRGITHSLLFVLVLA